jgi:hypothetical protein
MLVPPARFDRVSESVLRSLEAAGQTEESLLESARLESALAAETPYRS